MAGLSGLTRLAATAAHHLTHFFSSLGEFVFGDTAVAIGVHALEAFLGVAEHTATTLTFTSWRTTCSTGGTAGSAAFTAWGATEAAFTTGGTARSATWAHTLPTLSALTHHLGNLGDLVLIDEAITVGVHFAKALFAFFFAHIGKFVLADLAVGICVSAFDEFCETIGTVATTLWAAWGLAGLTAVRRSFKCAFLCGGEAGQAEDSEAVDEYFFEFHVVSAFGCWKHDGSNKRLTAWLRTR